MSIVLVIKNFFSAVVMALKLWNDELLRKDGERRQKERDLEEEVKRIKNGRDAADRARTGGVPDDGFRD